ncbi:uroporphyrinogen-III C-methyltransferase [Sulfuriflexus mobilis]|uniref:uroporphyrinogen-III C-methyltransferase n=1 Tax=Sulfuriflexus mobilis TaxID=1811807 RepID=UPI000F82D670|nr:uroporphyrinogen-III C-methyltransferase [Sulfuriflexus mobilis]
MNQSKKVYLVGTGPGDPELLTVKALRLLQNADVVIYDRLVSEAILEQIPAGVSRIYVGKKSGNHTLPQDEINQLLLNLAEGQRSIVRLKGGDPFIFGRGSEEALSLAKHGIAYEVVPGITAASACTTYAGIPLTHRGLAQGVQIVTGHSQAGQALELDWAVLADSNKTIVIYMGLANIDLITSKLMDAGLDANIPAAAIQNGTTARQQRVLSTLSLLSADVKKAMLQPPVIFVIGKVVSLARELDWFETEDAMSDYFADRNQSLHG